MQGIGRNGRMPVVRDRVGLMQQKAMDFLDMPSETAKSLYTAEITEKIARFIPELRVESVSWEASPAGTLIPKVVITNGGD